MSQQAGPCSNGCNLNRLLRTETGESASGLLRVSIVRCRCVRKQHKPGRAARACSDLKARVSSGVSCKRLGGAAISRMVCGLFTFAAPADLVPALVLVCVTAFFLGACSVESPRTPPWTL